MPTQKKLINNQLSGRILARNAIWNLAGMGAPMLVALVTIPIVIHGMGKDRYGLLSIIWLVVGYFSLFDMGIGRALTKFIAERLGRDKGEELPELIWTALWLAISLGAIGFVVGIILTKPVVYHLLNIPSALLGEGAASFRIASASIPVVILTAALIGVLEAHQRFAMITMVRVPLGVMTYLGPVISLQFSPSLVGVTSLLVAARIVAMVVYFALVLKVMPTLMHPVPMVRDHVTKLFSFGGWITVSNIVSPLMTYMDRFFIGSLLTMTAVAYYAAPYSMLANLQILPQAIMGVFFPALTMAMACEKEKLKLLHGRMASALFFLMFLVAGFAFLFAPELLRIWLGMEFSVAGQVAMRWLALGWIVSAIASAPFITLQGAGRPDLTAKVHLGLIVPYIVVLFWLTKTMGITGTAIAWSLRMLWQAIALNIIIRKELPILRRVTNWGYGELLASILFAVIGLLSQPLLLRVAIYVVAVAASGYFVYPLLRATSSIRSCAESFVLLNNDGN